MIQCLKSQGQDTNRVKTLNNLADNLRGKDPQKAVDYATEAIQLARKIGYEGGLFYGYQMKGAALQNLGKWDEAKAIYENGLKELKNPESKKVGAALYTRLGFVYYFTGKYSEALIPLRKSTQISLNGKWYDFASDAFRGLGMTYSAIGEYSLATQNFILSIENAEKSGNTIGVGYGYITLGNCQESQKDYVHALESFTKALKLLQSKNDLYGIAGCYISLGNIYMHTDDTVNARKNYELCINIRMEMNDEVGVAMAKEDIASLMNKEGKPEAALKYFEDGLVIFRKYNNQLGVAGSLVFMGNSYVALKNYTKAESCYLEGLAIAKVAHLNDWIKDAYAGLSKVYFETGKFKEAYLFKDSSDLTNTILLGEEHAAQSKEMEAKYENRKKEDEIKHLNEVNSEKDVVQQKQKQIIIAVSIGLVLVLLLAFFLVRINSERRRANLKLGEQNKVIAEKNKDITDSITYARRIQHSVLPDPKMLKSFVKDYFILNRPRDIVSGDFYWVAEKENLLYVAVADCTGHGVPGALVSVVGLNMLNKILEQPTRLLPAEILEHLHRMVILALHKDTDTGESNDGMDIALLCYDKKINKVYFSGAARPLYVCGKSGFEVIRGDRYSIAGEKKIGENPYSQHEISITGDTFFYLSSDGYADQFGEGNGKKFLAKRFQELLNSIHQLPMEEQREKINQAFEGWKGKLEQVDDVMVMGIQI